jgi:(p)ppGpp synthase/HD superfamily hydrolase
MTDVPDFAAESALLSGAYRFAREAHHGERRRGDTDVEHPTRVARLLHDAGFDERVVAAALLHDVVEDSATRVEEIRERFGGPVADLVAGMTEDESIEPYESRKAAHRDRVRGAGRDTAAIFAADKLANARDMGSGSSALDDAKLDHYERTLATLCAEHPDLDFLAALGRELRGIRRGDGPRREI